ncbi:folate-binding protein [Aquabacterium sp.]|uniref:CAF17-like 4Fe-4S cluster assembly/insertion protein YgfZ n=1 Tax=Aquabacterium sp. TaxID=1872578 RepID=UPI0019C78A02|nr:folate-binding protein [Aquabacterium sp.]MBC7700094.1 folate-binding protein YgfZ [Aquabacterium sp.]
MQDFHFPDPKALNGAVSLSHLGIISAEGADAASFLHGQLSQDVTGQTSNQARLAAFCSAKGRMLASFIVVKPLPETLWLLTDGQVLPTALKRLSMFVMRAKARLSDAASVLSAVGLVGPAAGQWLGDSALADPWQASPHAASGGHVVRLPDVLGAPRWLWIGPVEAAQALVSALPALPLAYWQWLDVMSGVVRIEPATVDQFVPQMVNYELVGGVHFQKGCYPGQEIVARSQYRGTLKRRTFLLHGNAPIQAGQEVFSAADPGQPAGMVANAAAIPTLDGQASTAFSALVELKWQALENGWHLGSSEGPALALGTMPYEVPLGTSDD